MSLWMCRACEAMQGFSESMRCHRCGGTLRCVQVSRAVLESQSEPLAASSPLAWEPTWQPIETAPKHQAVLVFYSTYREALTAIHGERGWSVAGLSEHYVVQTPQFWMPLPPAPKEPTNG